MKGGIGWIIAAYLLVITAREIYIELYIRGIDKMTTPQDNKLSAFLGEQKKLLAAVKHWHECAMKRFATDDGAWEQGPYPAMDKLIKMNEILLEACEFYSHSEEFESLKDLYKHDKSKVVVDFYGDKARKAIAECLKEIEK